jgi:hypothetical protein
MRFMAARGLEYFSEHRFGAVAANIAGQIFQQIVEKRNALVVLATGDALFR